MNIIRLTLILIFLSACSSPSVESELLDVDVEDLLLEVVLQFDEVMMEHTGASSPELAYSMFNDGILPTDSTSAIWDSVERIQPGVHDIIDRLYHHPAFLEIWEVGYSFNIENELDTLKSELIFNREGAYIQYLKQNETENSYIEFYSGSLQNAHWISPALSSSLPYSMEEFDLQRIEDRMFIAVHYVTLLSFRDKDDWSPGPNGR